MLTYSICSIRQRQRSIGLSKNISSDIFANAYRVTILDETVCCVSVSQIRKMSFQDQAQNLTLNGYLKVQKDLRACLTSSMTFIFNQYRIQLSIRSQYQQNISQFYFSEISMKQAFQFSFNKSHTCELMNPEEPKFSLIWLHGLGDKGASFRQYFMEDESPVYHGCRVLLPTAPHRRVTVNGGRYYNSWYDFKLWTDKPGTDEEKYSIEEIKESMGIIDSIVSEEIGFWKEKGMQSQQQICRKIFVGGLSQGCATSLIYALTCKRKLAGAIGFSGHLFSSFELANKDTLPMLVMHGDIDEVIKYEDAKPTYDPLKQQKNFTFKLFPQLGHWVTEEQLKIATEWMLHTLQLPPTLNQ